MELSKLKDKALRDIAKIDSVERLEALRIHYLGRKGEVTKLFTTLPKLNEEERKIRGQELNVLKREIEKVLLARGKTLEHEKLGTLVKAEKLDVTLPGARPSLGHLHITSQAIEEISRIFAQIGFNRVRYPEIDWDYYAFESLNMPKGHPARDEWETFFMPWEHPRLGRMVLTPHTSNGQVREMERRKPPIRMTNIAKCYRRQSDISHVPMFHQFEGLLVDRAVSVANLKGTLDYFACAFFGPDRKIRLRPFHFRFTEPSFEVDVSCGVCGGTGFVFNPSQPPLNLRGEEQSEPPLRLRGGVGELQERCRLCKSGWLELGGAGMVHPNVLKAGGLDPKEWRGFAFGWGVERTYMMKAGLRIDDIRVLYSNDLSFLEQF